MSIRPAVPYPEDDAELEATFPHIRWRWPMRITVSHDIGTDFGCRMCIARFGIMGKDVNDQPQTREAFDEHMRTAHPAKVVL